MKQIKIIEDGERMTNKETLKALRVAKNNLQVLINIVKENETDMNLDEFQCELANLVDTDEFEQLGLHFTQLEY